MHFYACSKDIKPLDDCHAKFLIFKTEKKYLSNKLLLCYILFAWNQYFSSNYIGLDDFRLLASKQLLNQITLAKLSECVG